MTRLHPIRRHVGDVPGVGTSGLLLLLLLAAGPGTASAQRAPISETAQPHPAPPQESEAQPPGRATGPALARGILGTGDPGVLSSAMTLVNRYRDAIQREVVNTSKGVVTTTWSALDSEAARTLQRHVVEMKAALERGETVRGWDPLFAEIFQHHDEIEMSIEFIEGGVRVTETSDNPEVVKLIQAHARKVNDFLARGPAAVHDETPLPAGYVDTRPQRHP